MLRNTLNRATDRLTAPAAAREPAGLSLRVDVPVLMLLALLAAAYAWMRTSMNGSYFRGDILTQFLPYYTEIADRVKSGDLPGWNPALFSGMPLAGDPVSGWSYLPVMVPFLLFNSLTAYKASVLIHLCGATIATYLLGRSLRMGPVGAAAAAIAYLLSPFYQYSQCCASMFQIGPLIPAGLLAIELSLRARALWQRLAAWFGVGVVLWQIIAGWFGKGMYFAALLFGAFLLYRTLIDPPGGRSPLQSRIATFLAAAAVSFGSAALFSAIVLLPRLEFLDNATLKGGSYESVAAGGNRPPSWSLGQAVSILLDPARPAYFLGVATVALAVAGLVLAGRRQAAPFFAIYGAIIVTLTLKETVVHRLFYLLPRFEDMHIHEPQRALALFNIAPALLAGAAVSAIELRTAPLRRIAIAAAAPLVAAGLVELLVRHDSREINGALFVISLLIGAVLLLGVVLAIYGPRRLGERLPIAVAVTLVLILLFNLDRGRLREATADGWQAQPVYDLGIAYADRDDAGGAGGFLREQQRLHGPFRYVGYNSAYLSTADAYMEDNYRKEWRDPLAASLLVNNRALALGLEDVQGYNPVQEMLYLQFINALNGQIQEYHETNVLPAGLNSPMLKLLNVRYIVIPLTTPDSADYRFLTSTYPEVFRDGDVRVLEVTNGLPRAWAVHQAMAVADDQVLATLASGSVDPAVTALVDTPGLSLSPLPAGTADQVAVTSYEPDAMTVTATMASDGLLMLSEVYDPGWSATIDGKAVPIYQADGLLRAIPVPAGEHTIRLTYQPRSLTYGTAITIAALLLAALAVVAAWRFPGLLRFRPVRWIAPAA